MGAHAGHDAKSHFDAAGECFKARQIERAIVQLNEAEQFGFNADECAAARWECWMLLGQFERAWAESDAIAHRGSPDPNRFWDGEPFTGKRVLVRCLHGLGDTIQFIRYAPMIRAEARSVTVEAHPEIVPLLRCAAGVDQAVTWGAASEWDSQVEINELPRIYRTARGTIPAPIPYLRIDCQILDPHAGRRVGLVWNSSQYNPARSIPVQLLLDALEDSLGKAGWQLFSLQFGPERDRVQPTRPLDGDVLDAAIDMMNLDLIVSVDTMAAHLAGALGKPVWVLLPFEADWRWMLNRSDSPWYPTMRLFRQKQQGDWSGALDDLRRAAKAL